MKLTPLLLLLTAPIAVLIISCSTEPPTDARSCPVINGVYDNSLTITTKVDDDNYYYNFGDGLLLEADGPAFGTDDQSIRATCGANSVTVHAKMNGRELNTTYIDEGDGTISVSSDGQLPRIMSKTAGIQVPEDPNHPDQTKICPTLNGDYVSDDGSITLSFQTTADAYAYGKDGNFGYKINQFTDYWLGFTRGSDEPLDEDPGIIANYSVDCSAQEDGTGKTLIFHAYDEAKKPEITLHATPLDNGKIQVILNGTPADLHKK